MSPPSEEIEDPLDRRLELCRSCQPARLGSRVERKRTPAHPPGILQMPGIAGQKTGNPRGPRQACLVAVDEVLELRGIVRFDPARGEVLRCLSATGTSYSVRMRSARTSNCRAPTTPTIQSAPIIGLKTRPHLLPTAAALGPGAWPERIEGPHLSQQLGSKGGQAPEVQILSFRQRVAEVERAVVRCR